MCFEKRKFIYFFQKRKIQMTKRQLKDKEVKLTKWNSYSPSVFTVMCFLRGPADKKELPEILSKAQRARKRKSQQTLETFCVSILLENISLNTELIAPTKKQLRYQKWKQSPSEHHSGVMWPMCRCKLALFALFTHPYPSSLSYCCLFSLCVYTISCHRDFYEVTDGGLKFHFSYENWRARGNSFA